MTARERLVQAARQCLLERGHQGASVKAIAERAGVNHGLVHHYFGSKEQLWVELVRSEAQRIRGSAAVPGRQFVTDFYIPELLRHPDRMRLAVEFLGLAKAFPRVGAELCEHFRLNRQEVRRVLGLPDDVSATLVFGTLFGLAIQASLDPQLPVEPAVRRLLERIAGAAPAADELAERRSASKAKHHA